jgi:hypothetical protein
MWKSRDKTLQWEMAFSSAEVCIDGIFYLLNFSRICNAPQMLPVVECDTTRVGSMFPA